LSQRPELRLDAAGLIHTRNALALSHVEWPKSSYGVLLVRQVPWAIHKISPFHWAMIPQMTARRETGFHSFSIASRMSQWFNPRPAGASSSRISLCHLHLYRRGKGRKIHLFGMLLQFLFAGLHADSQIFRSSPISTRQEHSFSDRLLMRAGAITEAEGFRTRSSMTWTWSGTGGHPSRRPP